MVNDDSNSTSIMVFEPFATSQNGETVEEVISFILHSFPLLLYDFAQPLAPTSNAYRNHNLERDLNPCFGLKFTSIAKKQD